MNSHCHIDSEDASTTLDMNRSSDRMELEELPWQGNEVEHLISTSQDSSAALHRAVQERNVEALRDLLQAANINLNYKSGYQGYTALMLAIEKMRDLYFDLPMTNERNEYKKRQIQILEDMIKELLEAGCNANTPDSKGVTPIYSAAEQGLRRVIDMILFYAKEPTDILFQPVNGETILQATIRGMGSEIQNPTADFNWCLNLFLKNSKINVNHLDDNNNTALHYAAKNGDDETVLKLLRHGACVGIRNKFNELPLADINADILEIYLDECITTNGYRCRPSDENYEMQMNYVLLATTNNSLLEKKNEEPEIESFKEIDASFASETDTLLYMTQNEELCPLLKHPVLTTFLYLKWQRISCLPKVNIAFYTLLCFFLSLYIIMGYSFEKRQSDSFKTVNTVVVIIGLIILILRELFQLVISPVRYLKGFENWMEIVLIGIIAWIVFSDSAPVSTKQQLSAVAILISSAELVLLIGKVPALSTNMLMLKTVSWNFFKFLLWYCILIIAFAFSFYTLFRQVEEDQTPPPPNPNNTAKEESEDFFNDPLRALFKTIVMLTGEFDAGSIKFNTFPITSHIIFIMFIFMIPIVLLNLLNGLAVSDTQKIRSDAELVGLISVVEFISYFESALIGIAKANKKTINCWSWLTAICTKPLLKRIFLFPHFLPGYRIVVKLNQDNKIMIPSSKESKLFGDLDSTFVTYKSFNGNLDKINKIVKNAKMIIRKKKNATELDDIKATFSRNETKIKSLETKIESLETKIESLETTNKSVETTNKSLETTNKSVETTLNKVLEKLERMSV